MTRHPDLAVFLVLIAVTALAYGDVFTNSFAFDDELIIARNRLVQSLTQIPTLFTTHYWAGSPVHEHMVSLGPILYRPLVMVTYALNYAVGGVHTAGYHLVNLLLHAAVSFLVFRLGRELGATPGGALAAAMVFAVLPIHTEAVTGIVGRAELMMGLGVLLSLLWYRRGWPPRGFDLRFAVLSWLAFVGALLSKEQAMAMPALLVLVDVVTRAHGDGWRFLRGAWSRYAGHVLLLAGLVVWRGVLFGGVFGGNVFGGSATAPFIDNPIAHVPTVTRLLTATKIAGWFLWLSLWPAHLSADYSFNAIPFSSSPLEPAVVAGGLAWVALLGLGVLAWRRRQPVTAFAVGLTAITFLPGSNLLVPSGTIMAERLFYLPSVGLCLLVGAGWDLLVAPRPRRPAWVRTGAIGVLILSLLAMTVRAAVRNRDWRDTKTLMEAAARVVPGSAKVVGNIARTTKDASVAIPLFQEAIQIYPTYPLIDRDFTAAYGSALLVAGRVDEAIEQLELAVRADSRIQGAYFNLGLAYVRKHRWAEAEAMFRNALALDGRSGVAYNGLSFALRAQEKFQEALGAADQAVRLAPDLTEARYNRGRALEGLGRTEEAVQAYEAALAHRPGYRLALDRLAELGARAR